MAFINNPTSSMGIPHGVQSIQNRSMHSIPNIGSGVSDDDFFHLTCHIAPSIIHKIRKRGICGTGEIAAER